MAHSDRLDYFAAFFVPLAANGEAALPVLTRAHLFLAASAIAFRPAALSFRFGGAAFAEAGLTHSGTWSAVGSKLEAVTFLRPDISDLAVERWMLLRSERRPEFKLWNRENIGALLYDPRPDAPMKLGKLG